MHPLNISLFRIQRIQRILRIQYWILKDPLSLLIQWILGLLNIILRFKGALRILLHL